MRVLLTGATGFVGRHLCQAMGLAGHSIYCIVRNPAQARQQLPHVDLIAADFNNLRNSHDWLPHLQSIDVVINAVGIFRETDTQTFSILHEEAPRALFEACAISGIPRVIQISALGAEIPSDIKFLESKRRTDEFLLTLPIPGIVVLPSPVFGEGGASARLFLRLAALPVLLLPLSDKKIQPVHIDDVCTAVLQLMNSTQAGRVAAVGPQSLSVRNYLAVLRAKLGSEPAHIISMPIRWLAPLQTVFKDWLSPTTLQLLEQSRYVDDKSFRTLLQRNPISPESFVNSLTQQARLIWLAPLLTLLRSTMVILWVATGILSLFIFPVAESLQLLARSGFPAPWGMPLLIIAALLDIALGLAIVFMRRYRRALWLLQGLVIAAYTVLISWHLPEFWAHPYGPILKNIPILAAIALLYSLEPPSPKNLQVTTSSASTFEGASR